MNEITNVIGSWVVKNSSSKRLEHVLELSSDLIEKGGFTEDLYVELTDGERLAKDAISSNFVSCLLSLINSILKNP